MPKENRERSLSLDRSSLSPFPCRSSSRLSLPKNPLEDDTNIKQWEDARCPVCMEHPHNAILLMCSSHEKGCRPFMCDTSHRHSNCFDQFRKSFKNSTPAELRRPEEVSNLTVPLLSATTPLENVASYPENETITQDASAPSAEDVENRKLVCPLCRGHINGSTVVESARHFMNAKSRSCASETCDYTGTYSELRKHARSVHPLVRPTDIDPERQRNWSRLERQRDLGDLLSTLQSSIGEGRAASDESTLTMEEGWMTVFFLVRFIRPENSTSGRSRSTRARAQVAVRRSPRRLWGETYDNGERREDEDTGSSDGEEVLQRHVRRRLNNPENQNQN